MSQCQQPWRDRLQMPHIPVDRTHDRAQEIERPDKPMQRRHRRRFDRIRGKTRVHRPFSLSLRGQQRPALLLEVSPPSRHAITLQTLQVRKERPDPLQRSSALIVAKRCRCIPGSLPVIGRSGRPTLLESRNELCHFVMRARVSLSFKMGTL
ncbi:hypothetical protein RPMA_18400 [Tardiphaga alba]|uniref:Uncharacterized protein n=1 Tax=Tardiphaga alba TaxID=340268 RepID=A0ABX8AAB4_9BRAD|nr:hypothetical protein RPMA_18400 [Tardiphaga alba]